MITKIKNWFLCWLSHDWTCADMEGIPATKEQLEGGVDGFVDYAKLYCRRCGHVPKR
jgi:hypothetical protein